MARRDQTNYVFICRKRLQDNGDIKLDIIKKVHVPHPYGGQDKSVKSDNNVAIAVPPADSHWIGRYPKHLLKNIYAILDE